MWKYINTLAKQSYTFIYSNIAVKIAFYVSIFSLKKIKSMVTEL